MNRFFILCSFLLLLAQSTFAQNKPINMYSSITVFDTSATGGVSGFTSRWIPVGKLEFFTLFATLRSGGSSFTAEVNDSLGFDIDYEIYHSLVRPTADSSGFTKKGDSGVYTEAMSFTTADTSYTKQYISLNVSSPALAACGFIRFRIDKDAINAKTVTKNVNLELILFRQN